MSEWLKEHAWKAVLVRITERHGNTSERIPFNDFRPQHVSPRKPVKVGVYRRFRGDLTQFLHSSTCDL
jgi:hypothetical protein